MSLISLLDPWEPSFTLVAVFVAVAVLFARGSRRIRISVVRQVAFWIGLGLFYIALHTRLDYYAEHQFFVHRLQHLVLHHLAPLILMAAYPGNADADAVRTARKQHRNGDENGDERERRLPRIKQANQRHGEFNGNGGAARPEPWSHGPARRLLC
jgi:hypothetical protein